MLPQQLIPLSWGLGLLAFLRHRAGGGGTVEPVWFSPSALGQELAALPCGVPSGFKELWLAVTMGERAGFRLAHGCSSGSAQVSHGLLGTHRHADLPCHVWAVDLLGV